MHSLELLELRVFIHDNIVPRTFIVQLYYKMGKEGKGMNLDHVFFYLLSSCLLNYCPNPATSLSWLEKRS